MATTRSSLAVTVHAVGWVVLIAVVLLARAGLPGDGWPTWIVLAAGVTLFAACAAWSAAQILDRVHVVEATAQSRVIRTEPFDPTRFHRLPREGVGCTQSRLVSSRYGSTTIIRRRDVASS